MPNYNTQLQSHNRDLESILQSLEDRATGNNNFNKTIGFFATTRIINNQSIIPSLSNYVGDVVVEGEET